jgi:hypothetical protein
MKTTAVSGESIRNTAVRYAAKCKASRPVSIARDLMSLRHSAFTHGSHCLAVFTTRDGRITAVREYFDTLHARDVVFA